MRKQHNIMYVSTVFKYSNTSNSTIPPKVDNNLLMSTVRVVYYLSKIPPLPPPGRKYGPMRKTSTAIIIVYYFSQVYPHHLAVIAVSCISCVLFKIVKCPNPLVGYTQIIKTSVKYHHLLIGVDDNCVSGINTILRKMPPPPGRKPNYYKHADIYVLDILK